MQVRIWICPTEGCGNYFASSSSVDLSTSINRRTAMRNLANEDPAAWSQVTGTRDECPNCRDRGMKVRRRPVDVEVEVADAAAV